MASMVRLRLLWRAFQLRGGESKVFRAFSAAAADEPLTFEVREYKAHKIDPPENKVTTSKDELMAMFQLMARMRRMEIASDTMYKGKFIRGFCHLYDGQEAVCVGMEHAITKKDSIITSYRDHCTHVGRGGEVREVLAELMGRTEGCSKGIGGSMHMYNKAANFYGGNGIVGAQIPLGVGLSFAHKYNEDGCCAFALYGDGAANQGQKYEAMNIAALWQLPIVFVCENNQYGMGTAIQRASFDPKFYTRGDYVPGMKVDGMDVLAVKKACTFAKEYVIKNGPLILEMDTYRFHGHSLSDPATYRSNAEVRFFREKCPIERVKKQLIERSLATAKELKGIEVDIKNEVNATTELVKNGTVPPNSWMWKNVYVNPSNVQIRGVDPSDRHPVVYDPEYKL